ncbi:MAG: cytosol nonspecific dipeptidase [Bacteroidetes bacterium CG2_30_33_31]|nr:MAG: cytosol nonspecific dipeptidase [Bacteroidetes bacterium CG2_30_33_31]
MNDITQLEPKPLWKYFHQITQIPRPSKKEENIRKFLVAFGKKLKLKTTVDNIGNVLIYKPATLGRENTKMVVLQCHMDMVCEKNSDLDFNFETDSIETKIDGEWVKAIGTTLGADDGIGIAASMAILADKTIEHGPIEALFTVDEETGLTGAFAMEKDFLKSKILLNLDSEDEGELFIGCAGGRDTIIKLPIEKIIPDKDKKAIKIIIGGLHGGHSGDDINKGFANANKLLTRVLYAIKIRYNVKLSDINGGNLRNALAREAFATLLIKENHVEKIIEITTELEKQFKNEYHTTEPNLFVKTLIAEKPDFVITNNNFDKLIYSLYACPHGVIAMSQDIENFVETSTNLASVKMKDDNILITTSQRSSVESSLNSACEMVRTNFLSVGGKVEHTDGYPGWTPNLKSEIVEITKKAYKELFNKEPKVLAIHAGLECGLIGKKYPLMDMISFGPTIKGAHSPDERIKIDTAKMFWDLLVELLRRIPEEK